MQNPYIPYPVVVDKIITEVDTKDIKTFRFKFVNPGRRSRNTLTFPVSSASCPFTAKANRPSVSLLLRRKKAMSNSPCRKPVWSPRRSTKWKRAP